MNNYKYQAPEKNDKTIKKLVQLINTEHDIIYVDVKHFILKKYRSVPKMGTFC